MYRLIYHQATHFSLFTAPIDIAAMSRPRRWPPLLYLIVYFEQDSAAARAFPSKACTQRPFRLLIFQPFHLVEMIYRLFSRPAGRPL